jgi:predicted transcriptional regulator
MKTLEHKSINSGNIIPIKMLCCSRNGECVELTKKEAEVCSLICSRKSVNFSSIAKVTGLHHELVSRILRRLVLYGLAEKDEEGRYKYIGMLNLCQYLDENSKYEGDRKCQNT